MSRCSSLSRRQAFTLLELVVSMSTATVLIGGMSSAMFIAMRASDPKDTPAHEVSGSATCLADLNAELQFAQSIVSASATSLTVTIPDRGDPDATAETIRYDWAGGALTRQFNSGSIETIISQVQAVAVDFQPSAAAPAYVTIRIHRSAGTQTVVEANIPLLNL